MRRIGTKGVMTEANSLQVDLVQSAPINLDVHFRCKAGEVLALVGPSGSGKSTILRNIAGLSRPKYGRIVVNGKEWLNTEVRRNVSARLRSVGMVFQDYALFPHLTALENVLQSMQVGTTEERLMHATNLLVRVHMQGLEHRRPNSLSGGQQQRVAVARALARNPEVLLLDEPFSAVDQVTREILYEELAVLRQGLAIPIVFVTHSLQEAALLADKMCVLNNGTTLQLAPPLEVMSQPASFEVAKLVALRNVFTGVVTQSREGLVTELNWGTFLLEAQYDVRFQAGDKVYWTIPDSHIIMHRIEKTYRVTTENVVSGTIVSTLTMGSTTQLKLWPRSHGSDILTFSVPTHFAQLNKAAVGAEVSISLPKNAIHLMPHS